MHSVQRSMCAAILILEAVVFGLTTPVMISVADVEVTTALWVGLGLSLACIVTSGLLRKRWAFSLGWVIQVASLGFGFVIPMMFLLGVIFASLWAGAYFLGRKVDAEKAERAVIEEQWAASDGEASSS